MVNKTRYRLGEYLIAEDGYGQLRWETHFNFGVQRSGKCYILGNILILGNWSHEESGYLQLEFSELLQKLPNWNRTRYYCLASELLDVSTGQILTNDYLEHYIALTRSPESKPLMNVSSGMFKLGRYQITIDDNGEILWQTYEGSQRVVGGQCVIESDVLFIGPQTYDEGNQSKQEFLNKLHQLPQWDKTLAWTRSLVLRPCHIESQQTEKPGPANLHQYIMDEQPFDEKPSALYLTQYKKTSEGLLRLIFKWLKTVQHYICGEKRWLKYLIILSLVLLLLGFLMIWHPVEKKSLSHHGGKQHHREHDD